MWLYIVVGALCVSVIGSLLIGDALAANGGDRSLDEPLVVTHDSCAVLEVRSGAYPVAVLLPQRSCDARGNVTTGAELKLVYVSLQGDLTGGVAAVLSAAAETGSRVDVTITSHSDDSARCTVRTVDVSVTGGGGSVRFATSDPHVTSAVQR